MNVDKQVIKYIVAAIISSVILVGVVVYPDILKFIDEVGVPWGRPEPAVVSDLAYTVNRWIDNIIYINEYGELTPYLVVDDNYGTDDDTLLLRYHLTDEAYVMGEEGDYENYYKNCKMDRYLQSEYIDRFDIKDIICDTNVEIICKDSRNTEYIVRKIFLLSSYELCLKKKNIHIVVEEGEELEYFKNIENICGYTKEGELSSSWLRSRTVTGDFKVTFNVVSGKVYTFGDGRNSKNYIRPAFCLKDDTPIKQQEFNGKMVYVLAQ